MKKPASCFLFSFILSSVVAQCLTAFKDTRPGNEQLYIFDNGKIMQQEYKAISFSVGRTMIAYLNSGSELKVYKNGQTLTLNNLTSAGFYADDNFVFSASGIFDGKKFYDRCELDWKDEHSLLEDTVNFFNRRKEYLARYCADDISEIYDRLFDDSIHTRQFRGGSFYFVRGKQFVKLEREPASFETNKSVAAFVDDYDDLKAIYNGEVFFLEDNAPEYYKTGEDLVAYLSSTDDSFKVFHNGRVYPLLGTAPKSYFVHKDLLVYFDLSDFFYVFSKGKNVKLANYHPEEIKTDRGILVFKDLDNRLQGFIDGKQQSVSAESVSEFTVVNKAVMFYKTPSRVNVFCNGKITQAY